MTGRKRLQVLVDTDASESSVDKSPKSRPSQPSGDKLIKRRRPQAPPATDSGGNSPAAAGARDMDQQPATSPSPPPSASVGMPNSNQRLLATTLSHLNVQRDHAMQCAKDAVGEPPSKLSPWERPLYQKWARVMRQLLNHEALLVILHPFMSTCFALDAVVQELRAKGDNGFWAGLEQTLHQRLAANKPWAVLNHFASVNGPVDHTEQATLASLETMWTRMVGLSKLSVDGSGRLRFPTETRTVITAMLDANDNNSSGHSSNDKLFLQSARDKLAKEGLRESDGSRDTPNWTMIVYQVPNEPMVAKVRCSRCEKEIKVTRSPPTARFARVNLIVKHFRTFCWTEEQWLALQETKNLREAGPAGRQESPVLDDTRAPSDPATTPADQDDVIVVVDTTREADPATPADQDAPTQDHNNLAQDAPPTPANHGAPAQGHDLVPESVVLGAPPAPADQDDPPIPANHGAPAQGHDLVPEAVVNLGAPAQLGTVVPLQLQPRRRAFDSVDYDDEEQRSQSATGIAGRRQNMANMAEYPSGASGNSTSANRMRGKKDDSQTKETLSQTQLTVEQLMREEVPPGQGYRTDWRRTISSLVGRRGDHTPLIDGSAINIVLKSLFDDNPNVFVYDAYFVSRGVTLPNSCEEDKVASCATMRSWHPEFQRDRKSNVPHHLMEKSAVCFMPMFTPHPKRRWILAVLHDMDTVTAVDPDVSKQHLAEFREAFNFIQFYVREARKWYCQRNQLDGQWIPNQLRLNDKVGRVLEDESSCGLFLIENAKAFLQRRLVSRLPDHPRTLRLRYAELALKRLVADQQEKPV